MTLTATERLYLADDDCLEHRGDRDRRARRDDRLRPQLFLSRRWRAADPTQGTDPLGRRTDRVGDRLRPRRRRRRRLASHRLASRRLRSALPATLAVDAQRRRVLARYHTVLHVLNTIARRDYGGWITGAQIGVEYSRIDFRLDGFSAALCGELEAKANAVLAADHALRAYDIDAGRVRRPPRAAPHPRRRAAGARTGGCGWWRSRASTSRPAAAHTSSRTSVVGRCADLPHREQGPQQQAPLRPPRMSPSVPLCGEAIQVSGRSPVSGVRTAISRLTAHAIATYAPGASGLPVSSRPPDAEQRRRAAEDAGGAVVGEAEAAARADRGGSARRATPGTAAGWR